MSVPLDLRGHRYGKLLVLDETMRSDGARRRWLCVCDCGRQRVALGHLLRSLRVNSCGGKDCRTPGGFVAKPRRKRKGTTRVVPPKPVPAKPTADEAKAAEKRLNELGGYWPENHWYLRNTDPERYRPPVMPGEYAAGVRAERAA